MSLTHRLFSKHRIFNCEYISPSWRDISGLVFPILISLIENGFSKEATKRIVHIGEIEIIPKKILQTHHELLWVAVMTENEGYVPTVLTKVLPASSLVWFFEYDLPSGLHLYEQHDVFFVCIGIGLCCRKTCNHLKVSWGFGVSHFLFSTLLLYLELLCVSWPFSCSPWRYQVVPTCGVECSFGTFAFLCHKTFITNQIVSHNDLKKRDLQSALEIALYIMDVVFCVTSMLWYCHLCDTVHDFFLSFLYIHTVSVSILQKQTRVTLSSV